MDRIPSLKGLQYFEVVSRHMSFTLAADELFVTQAAISQQIRNLEEQLGFKLFIRSTRQLHLTDNAERLLPHVRKGFAEIRKGLDKVSSRQYDYLNISILPSFAARWLVPRLGRFSINYPEIEVRLLPSIGLVDFQKENIDLAVRFGMGKYPGLYSEKLMDEYAFPVCSPELMSHGKGLGSVADLINFPLLQDSGPGVLTWRDWLQWAGSPDLDVRYGVQISDASLLLEAAKDGQGVALGRASLVQRELEQGSLIKLFDIELASSFSYFLVMPQRSMNHGAAQKFADWLRQECKQSYRVDIPESSLSEPLE
ncbi:transcriptional regulator GcvA [Endozoicomonas arenosclerae]|uniref:transcriptional regulator GcvA n=1 Tax=Endozoicomonas arenosclerae TaxID=1633495 RepID=UPI000780F6EC|nr:transcriptional regulator GcvA [Endozoicomonas arenosclerae]